MFFGYIKVYHPFWYLQPVFHFYDIKNYFLDPHIIDTSPSKTKYLNTQDIQTYRFSNLSETLKQDVIKVIRENFLKNGKNQFAPDLSGNFMPYFSGDNEKSFLTIYYRWQVIMDAKTSHCVKTKNQIVGVIASCPLNVRLDNTTFKANYVDYLCVVKEFRKQGKAEQLIQTHDFNQRQLNPAVQVSLFKREGPMNFIVPLCVFKSYIINTESFYMVESIYKVTDKVNRQSMVDFLKINQPKFDCVINLSYSTLFQLMDTGNMMIYSVINNDSEIEALYVFKDSCTFYKENEKLLSCTASICSPTFSSNEFLNCFEIAVQMVVKQHPVFTKLVIEALSDNHLLILPESIFFHDMAYFFYNYTHQSFSPSKVLFLG